MRNSLGMICLLIVALNMAGSLTEAEAGQTAPENNAQGTRSAEAAAIPRFNPRCDVFASKNLVRNASFECGAESWSSLGKQTGWGGDLSGLYGDVVSGEAWDGTHCLKISMGPGATPVTYFDVWPPIHERQHAPLAANVGWMSVTPGEPLTLSAYLKSNVAGAKARFLFRFAKNALEPVQQAVHEVTLSPEWTRYSVTQAALNEDVCIAVGPDMSGMPDTAASFWLDAVQLEAGSQATAFETREPVELGVTTGHYGNVFFRPESVTFNICGDNRSGVDVSVLLRLEIQDYFGRALFPTVCRVELPEGRQVAVPWVAPVTGKGHYRANVTWTANGRDHARTFAFTVVEPYPHDDSPFGLNHPATTDAQLKLLSKAGIRWVRNWAVNWEWVEPVSGQLSWDEQDEQMRYLSAAGMKTLSVFPNPSTNWASTAPPSVEQTLWHRMAYMPAEPRLLFDFIGKAVGRYQGSCVYWEFLNEPLWVPDFCLPKSQGYKVADYMNLLKGAHAAIKAANPNARVIAGLATEPEDLLGDEFIAEGGLRYCDIFNLHPYGRLTVPEIFIERMERTQKAMDASGERRPIWATETSYYAVDEKPWMPWVAPPDHFSAGLLWPSERIAADYVVRHAIILLAHGVEKIFYHEPIEGPVNIGTMDIENTFLSPDAVPRKSYAAISALANLLGPSPRYVGQPKGPEAKDAFGYAFQCNDRALLAVWAPRNDGGAKAHWIDIPEGIEVSDIMGNRVGAEKITLSESPVYLQSDSLTTEGLIAACTIKSDIP